jgi:hypothetical protein
VSDTRRELFVIGDSISVHYGPHLQRMTEGVLDYRRLVDPDSGEPQNGGDSGAVRCYLEGTEERFDLLLINCGLHDLRKNPQTGAFQVPLPEYVENVRALLERAGDLASQVIWVRTTGFDQDRHNRLAPGFHRFEGDLTSYNAEADRVVAGLGLASCDLFGFTRSLGSDLWGDHVHFTQEVCVLQGAYVEGFLMGRLQ